jgi:hypothetical protein
VDAGSFSDTHQPCTKNYNFLIYLKPSPFSLRAELLPASEAVRQLYEQGPDATPLNPARGIAGCRRFTRISDRSVNPAQESRMGDR